MRILLDFTYIDPSNPTGVSTYAIRLAQGFCSIDQDLSIIASPENKKYVESLFPHINILLLNNILSCNGIEMICLRYRLKRKLNRLISDSGADFYILPFYTLWSLTPNCYKTIVVVHDVQPLVLNQNSLYNYLFRRGLKNVESIVTISQYSKQEIIRFFPDLTNKIDVIYNSIDGNTKFISEGIMDKPYILSVNAMEEYKNHLITIKAFNEISDAFPHKLIIKSKSADYWINTCLPFVKEHHLENRVTLLDASLSSDEMSTLYCNADLFVSSSLMEGFGFTPIEAALHEIPVITSKSAALYETTQGLLNYYEPTTDYFSLACKMREVLCEKPSKDTLHKIATCYKETYSIERQAKAFINLLNTMP